MLSVASLARRRAVLAFSGADALTFLNGITSNDVRLLETISEQKQQQTTDSSSPTLEQSEEPSPTPLSVLYTGFFNPKGRIICEGFLYTDKAKSRYLFECDMDARDLLKTHIRKYKLRTKVTLEDISDEKRVYVAFPSLESPRNGTVALENIDILKQTLLPNPAAIAVADPRIQSLGYRLIVDETEKLHYTENKFMESSPDLYDIWRYYHGIPEGVKEIPPDEALPFESNFDYTNGVNFHKGCYIGQELTARTFYTGVTRKRVAPLQFCTSSDDVDKIRATEKALYDPNFQWTGDEVNYGESNVFTTESKSAVGKLYNRVGNIGLGLLRLEHIGKGMNFFVQPGKQPFVPFIPEWWSNFTKPTQTTS